MFLTLCRSQFIAPTPPLQDGWGHSPYSDVNEGDVPAPQGH